jgi:FemAB-related protein (PEP-CTERM system-associated)
MTDGRSLEAQATFTSRPLASVRVGALEAEDASEIDRFVTRSRSGTFCHLSGWSSVVREVFRHQTFSLVARRGKQITGVFPVSLVRSRFFGSCLVSLPLAVYGGVCADDEESYSELLAAASKLANELKVKYLEMRNRDEPFATSLPGRDLYVTFTQDLTLGPEKLLQNLPRDTRYMVRKSLKAGLEWTEDLTLEEFYEIYARSVHRLGTPVFPRRLFTCFRSTFARQCRVFGVRKGKIPIAGVLCFYFRDQVLPYYAGSLAEFAQDAPNNFMYWNLMLQSCREGLRVFDFGRSKRGTGSFHFKSSWSMRVTELPYRYHLVRATKVPEMSPVDQKFRAAVALWKRLPFPVTKILGPRLIRCVPSV